jgi:hypothetical protein
MSKHHSVTLDELERLEKSATPGPWRECKEDPERGTLGTSVVRMYNEPDYVLGLAHDWGEGATAREDAALIAAARNALPELIKIAKAVAKLDTCEPDGGWPMGQACRTCRGFGAYATDLSDAPQPDTGSLEAEWEAYRAFLAKRDAEAVAAIQHEGDCAWVAARALLRGGTK